MNSKENVVLRLELESSQRCFGKRRCDQDDERILGFMSGESVCQSDNPREI